MSSDMEQEPIILESMPLRNIEKLTLQVDVLKRSDGRWSTGTFSVQKLFYVSRLSGARQARKVNLNESQERKQEQPELLLV
jgi:hypothetical protein